MNIILRELKAHRKSLIIWTIAVAIMVASGMSKYGGMSGSGQSINELMGDMPKVLQAIMGFNSLDLTTALGFYGVLFLYLVIMLTVHSSMLGAGIISKEERDKTVEFLMVKPVTRNYILTSKFIAAIFQMIWLNLVCLGTSIGMVAYYNEAGSVTKEILIMNLGILMLQFVFFTVGTGIAAWKRRSKTAPSLATGILLFTFILSIMVDMTDKLERLKYLTPFKYVVAEKVINGEGIDGVFILLSFVIIIIMTTVTFIFYRKRDLLT